jgi:hypothetical protein
MDLAVGCYRYSASELPRSWRGRASAGMGLPWTESARRTGWFRTGWFLTATPYAMAVARFTIGRGTGTVKGWLLAVRLARGRWGWRLEVGHCLGARVVTRQVGSC